MARDIDDTDAVTAGQIEIGKAQLDGDPPFLFLFQAIGFNTRQGPDEAGLTMIDMAGGAENDITHRMTEGLKSVAQR